MYHCAQSATMLPADACREIGDGGGVGEVTSEREGAAGIAADRSGSIARLFFAPVHQQQRRARRCKSMRDGLANLSLASTARDQDRSSSVPTHGTEYV